MNWQPHHIPMAKKFKWSIIDRDASRDGWCWGMFKTEAEAQRAADDANRTGWVPEVPA